MAAVVASGLLLGGTAMAYADGTVDTPSSPSTTSSSTAPSDSSGGATSSSPRPPAHQPHIDGTVASVSENSITVTDPDGFTRTVVTSSATTYGDGLSSPVAMGTRIHATGTVDANGTILDATEISTPPQPPAPPAGPGGKAGHGPGAGPGGEAGPVPGAGGKVRPGSRDGGTAPAGKAGQGPAARGGSGSPNTATMSPSATTTPDAPGIGGS